MSHAVQETTASMNVRKFGRKTPTRACLFCGGPHFDAHCTVYGTVEQRLQQATQRGIACIRCLARNHAADACPSAVRGCVFCRSPLHNAAFCQKAMDHQSWRQKNACAFCDGSHMDIDCTRYTTASARTLQAQQRGRCLGCLGANHSLATCRSPRIKCMQCHHLALSTARSDVTPYHNVTFCPVNFPDTAQASDGVGGSGAQTGANAEVMPGGRCDDHGPGERIELDKLKEQLEDEKNQLNVERKGLEAAILEREAAVKRREEQIAADNSRMAEERGRIEKAKTQLADLEKELNDRETKLREEEIQLSKEKAAFEQQQQLQAGSRSTLAQDELQVEMVREENRRLHCELAQMTRERDAACAVSEERKGELDQAHKTLSEQFRKRRELRDVYYQLEAQRDRYKAEKEALQLTLQFRDEEAQQADQGIPQPTSPATVRIKQEVLDSSEMEDASAALGGGKRPSHSTDSTSGTKRQRQQWDDAAVDALKQRLADLANECGGEPDTWQTVVKYNAFIEANIRRVGNSTALIDFLKRAEPVNSSIADRIERLVNRN